MSEEEKMLWLFAQVHGTDWGPSFSVEYRGESDYNEDGDFAPEEAKVHLLKDGHSTWSVTKGELLFDYLITDELINKNSTKGN